MKSLYRKPRLKPGSVTVKITTRECVDSELESHRDLVLLKFQEAGYAVINFNELRFFYQPHWVIVEGIPGKAILSL